MADVELPTVEIITGPNGEMFFVGYREIEKPKQLAEVAGEIVAFSETGLGGKRHIFTARQVADVQNMMMVGRPDWLGANGDINR